MHAGRACRWEVSEDIPIAPRETKQITAVVSSETFSAQFDYFVDFGGASGAHACHAVHTCGIICGIACIMHAWHEVHGKFMALPCAGLLHGAVS